MKIHNRMKMPISNEKSTTRMKTYVPTTKDSRISNKYCTSPMKTAHLKQIANHTEVAKEVNACLPACLN